MTTQKIKIYFSILLTITFGSCINEQQSPQNDTSATKKRDVAGLEHKRGLTKIAENVIPGYILFSPTNSASTYLMNRQGEIVHEWKGWYQSWSTYLQDNGHVFRISVDPDAPVYYAGGMAGRIEELDWNGDLLWEFEYATEAHQNHHDFTVLPNGNILAIAWERRTAEEAINAGRNPDLLAPDGIWFDKIIEIRPTRPKGGEIVWEWRFWDHLIQDFDPDKANFGTVSDHPELLDINATAKAEEQIHPDTLRKWQKSGDEHRNATTGSRGCDFFHCNAIKYNADLDQIVFSSPELSEIFIIDHSTTTQESAGHRGGQYSRGGDFLFRWGNPQNYRQGDSTDRQLFYQHDVRWIEKGMPGQGHLSLYNNKIPNGPNKMPYSAIFELVLDIDNKGLYGKLEDGTFAPEKPIWTYVAEDTLSLFSPFTSGAQRMYNGNTFILAGAPGRMLEVTPHGEIVWEYWTPYRGEIRETNGDIIKDGPEWFWMFRANYIPMGHPALSGKSLAPIEPQPAEFDLASFLDKIKESE